MRKNTYAVVMLVRGGYLSRGLMACTNMYRQASAETYTPNRSKKQLINSHTHIYRILRSLHSLVPYTHMHHILISLHPLVTYQLVRKYYRQLSERVSGLPQPRPQQLGQVVAQILPQMIPDGSGVGSGLVLGLVRIKSIQPS